MQAKTLPKFASLCFVAVAMVLGNSMLIPVLPLLKRALDLSLLEAGLVITTFSVAAGLSIPVAGYISDKVGRKLIISIALCVYGLAGSAIGLVGAALGDALIPILALRAVQGVGAGGTFQIAMALTGDIFSSRERTEALGYLEAANGMGKVAAPLIGASLGLLAWFAPFFAYTLALPVAVAVWLTVEEPPMHRAKAHQRGEYWGSLGEVFTRSGLSLAVLFLCGLLALFLYFGVLSILSDLLEDRANIEGVMLGLVIAIPVFAMALSSFLSGRWLSQQPANVLRLAVVAGLTLAATGLFASGFMRNPLWLVGTIAGMGVGNGIVLPALNSLVTSTAGRGGRGLVTSLYGTARHIGAASGPPALAAAIGLGRQPVFWTLAAVVLGVAVAAFYLIETEQLLDDRAAEHPQHFHAH